jgi:hypothetical protein
LALLPTFERFSNYLLETTIPIIESFINGITNVGLSADEASIKAFEFGERVRSIIKFIISIKDELFILGGIIATVFVANKIIAFVASVKTLVTAMIALRNAAAAAGAAVAFATGGTSLILGGAAAGIAGLGILGRKEFESSLPGGAVSTRGNPGQTIINNNISVSSVDSEGAARAVAKVVNESAARSVPLFTGNGIRLQ